MSMGIKNLTVRQVLPVVGGLAVGGLIVLLWPYWPLLLVIAAVAAYCFVAYQSAKMRRD